MDEALNKEFLEAINRGGATLVTQIISEGANIEFKDHLGQTPLLIASGRGRLEVVRILIERGCDLKVQDQSGQNALHKAILGGLYSENIVSKLLDTDCMEYDLKDNQGKSPLDYAKEKWSGRKAPNGAMEKILDLKCRDLLRKSDLETLFADQDLVIYLIKKGSPEILELIQNGMAVGIKVNDPGICYSKSPLYYAFKEGHSVLFETLISLGADISSLGIDPNLPFNYNCPALKVDCNLLNILMQQGFNLDAQDESGNTGLNISLEYSQKETAESLIKLGCNVNLSDENSRSPLHKVMHAILKPSDRMHLIDMLLNCGANPNAKDKNGRTPFNTSMGIYYILPEEKIEILYKFLDRGIDINSVDDYGQNPFRRALDVFLNLNSCHTNHFTAFAIFLQNRGNLRTFQDLEQIKKEADLYLKEDSAFYDENDSIVLTKLLIARLNPNEFEDTEQIKKVLDIYLEAESALRNKLQEAAIGYKNMTTETNLYTFDYMQLRELLDEYIKAESVFSDAKHLSVLGILLLNGADPNTSCCLGRTLIDLIHAAPFYDRTIGLLGYILHNAQVNNPNHLEQNLLHIAAQCVGWGTMSELLAKYPKVVSLRDYEGKTILHFATSKRNLNLARMLLERFPDLVNEKDLQELTPLHIAASTGNEKTVKLLIKYQSDIKALDKSGNSPADYAAIAANDGLMEALEELLDKGGVFSIKPQFSEVPNNTLLHKAIKNGATLTAIYLIRKNFDIHHLSFDQSSTINLAISNDQDKIAFALLDKDPTIAHLEDSHGSTLNNAIQKGNVKIIAKLINLGVFIDLKLFHKIVNTLDKKNYVSFFDLMLKCLDPKTNIVGKDPHVYSKALEQICDKVDGFKAQSKEYFQLEALRDICKSLKNIVDNPGYFNFFDQQRELLELCQSLLPNIEKEYSTLSTSHFEYLLSKSNASSLERYKLQKTPDANVIKNIVEYLKYEGHKLLEVSKAGVNILLAIQFQPTEDFRNDFEVKAVGLSDECEL